MAHRATPTEPVVVKTHYPFHKPAKHIAPAAAILLLVRNPLSNYDGWRRYLNEVGKPEVADLTLVRFSRYWGSHVKFWVTRATVLCVRLYEVRYEDLVNAEAAGLYGILKGTGLFDDLGLRSSAVRRGIAASRAAPLRSMKGAPPEVQGSGEIVSGKHRVGPKNEVDEDK